MIAAAKPMTRSEFEALKRRVTKNNDTLVDPQVVLQLVATVELQENRLRRCLTGNQVEAWT
jgi:hypothetical protein